jgi:mRNA-degrading endonuclease RelE of RelBE toxin-antitoxin system
MNYDLVASELFLEQIKSLPGKYKKQIKNKIELIKQNPFRFKKIHSKRFSLAFRVRLSVEGKETRLVYVVLGSKIVLACLLDRSKDYKDMESHLSKIENL